MNNRAYEKSLPIWADVIWNSLMAMTVFGLARRFINQIWLFSGIGRHVFQVALFTVCMILFVRSWSKRYDYTLADCRLKEFKLSWKDIAFALGFPLGMQMILSLFAEEIYFSGQPQGSLIPIYVAEFLHYGIGSGFNEELVYRGYLMKVLEDKIGIKKAILIVSLVFGCAHLFNGNMTPWMMVFVVLGTGSMGALLAVVTYESGSIWKAVLLHACINLSDLVIGSDAHLIYRCFPFEMTEERLSCLAYLISAVMSGIVIFIYYIKKRRTEAVRQF
ncbi:MAG: CPBP family intramembrane metalloprotease [Lachnospiraceae bacterium]|nr:CPBP family intramembrane metalloprotease [Lachnospiraceae bacterium]